MKKSQLKSIIKTIILEAQMANVFQVVLKGDKASREMVARSFVKTGKGKLPVQVSFPDANSTSYSVWDSDVLKTIETILQGMNWKREGVKDKTITWVAPS